MAKVQERVPAIPPADARRVLVLLEVRDAPIGGYRYFRPRDSEITPSRPTVRRKKHTDSVYLLQQRERKQDRWLIQRLKKML